MHRFMEPIETYSTYPHPRVHTEANASKEQLSEWIVIINGDLLWVLVAPSIVF